MGKYKLSNQAKQDLIRIHHYGIARFGETQADKYFYSFFKCFERIAAMLYAFESIDSIKKGYQRCVYGADSIYFRIIHNEVEIISIIGRQDLGQALT